MRPIPQTVEVAAELSRDEPDLDVLHHLQSLADQVQRIVPDCIGMSIGWIHRGVAFTLVATDEEIAALDAVQYLDGGPCQDVVDSPEPGLTWSATDPLDEATWRGFAQATAARGVRSTLTMPLVSGGDVVGTANLYAASDYAFENHLDALALLLGGSVNDIVRNADLSFATRLSAEQAPKAMRSADQVVIATGLLIAQLGLDSHAAAHRLEETALRAGITPAQLAQALINLFSQRD